MPVFDFGPSTEKPPGKSLDFNDSLIDCEDWPDDFSAPENKTKGSNFCSLLRACEPNRASDLAVSRQKQQEISNWFARRTKKSAILVISGPSGCGKTQATRVLAKEHGFDVVEWISPLDAVVDENCNFRSFRWIYVDCFHYI